MSVDTAVAINWGIFIINLIFCLYFWSVSNEQD